MLKKGLTHVFQAHTQGEKENRRSESFLHFSEIQFTENAETLHILKFTKNYDSTTKIICILISPTRVEWFHFAHRCSVSFVPICPKTSSINIDVVSKIRDAKKGEKHSKIVKEHPVPLLRYSTNLSKNPMSKKT